MSNISTKLIEEIWDDDSGKRFVIFNAGGVVCLEEQFNGVEQIYIEPEMIGKLVRALNRVAENVVENRNDD